MTFLLTQQCIATFRNGNAKAFGSYSEQLYVLEGEFTVWAWHQFAQWFQARIRDKPAWQQNFVALAKPIGTIIAPWLVIVSVLVSAISDLLNHNWAIEALASAAWGLPIIFLSVEDLFVRNQIRQ